MFSGLVVPSRNMTNPRNMTEPKHMTKPQIKKHDHTRQHNQAMNHDQTKTHDPTRKHDRIRKHEQTKKHDQATNHDHAKKHYKAIKHSATELTSDTWSPQRSAIAPEHEAICDRTRTQRERERERETPVASVAISTSSPSLYIATPASLLNGWWHAAAAARHQKRAPEDNGGWAQRVGARTVPEDLRWRLAAREEHAGLPGLHGGHVCGVGGRPHRAGLGKFSRSAKSQKPRAAWQSWCVPRLLEGRIPEMGSASLQQDWSWTAPVLLILLMRLHP